MKKRTNKASQTPAPGTPRPPEDGKIQGEGDHAADRRYRERTDRFLESADVDELAHEAAPTSEAEAEEMKQAEDEGRSHAHLPKRRKGEKKEDARRK